MSYSALIPDEMVDVEVGLWLIVESMGFRQERRCKRKLKALPFKKFSLAEEKQSGKIHRVKGRGVLALL